MISAANIPTAYAEDSDAGWKSKTINIIWNGLEVKNNLQGTPMRLEGIYSGNAETTGNVAFTCHAGRYYVNIALAPTDMESLFTAKSRRRKLRRPNITIDGEIIKSTDWIYIPKLKIYRARRKSTAAKIYNSVIRRSVVTMESHGSGKQELILPKPDENFKNFGADCGLGVLAKKS